MGVETQESFGSLVRRCRRAAELTQEALAERAGLSVRVIRKIETGSQHRPRRDTVQLLLEALAIPAEEQEHFRQAAGQAGAATTPAITDRDAAAPSAIQVLSVLIADMRGYTAYTVEQGDEAGARLAKQFEACTTAVVAQHGGTVLELRGDEALCTFASARQALRAALALQERYRQNARAGRLPLGVGIGVDAGELVAVGNGYRGRALNLAARLCSLATGGDILVSDGVLHLAGAMEGITWVDRGPVSLNGLPEPVRALQVGHAGDRTPELPPLQPLVVSHPTNLPDEATPFIGREREVAQIAGMLHDPHTRLVTLTGAGGSGKTRLALRVAATSLPAFRDGVFLCDLAPLGDPAFVVSAVAETLAVKEAGTSSLLDAVTAHLQEKQLLLVLDNYEHLLDAASVVASLLDACRELRVLVTSRIPLHLSREHEYAVLPLAVPAPNQALDAASLMTYDGAALFIDRARAVKADFLVTDATAPVVAEICSRLDGLPLAIELAAARVKLFPPQALLGRLSSKLALLTGGARDRPARQQTLRNTIDWSYALLPDEEQTLFARLSVFAGGCSFEAAEAVCSPEGGLDLLAAMGSLVDKSLLRQEGQDDAPRFGMLETIREYAAETLVERGQAEAIHRGHAAYYLQLAEAAQPGLSGPTQAEWRARLDDDLDNLRRAMRWFLDPGEIERAQRLGESLWYLWFDRGYWSELRRWVEELIAKGDGLEPGLRAKVLSGRGYLAGYQGDFQRAKSWLEAALALYQELEDKRGIADSLDMLGSIAELQGACERARERIEEVLRLRRELGDKSGIARTVYHLGRVAWRQGEYERAGELYEESLRLSPEPGNKSGIAESLRVRGQVAWVHGEYERARELQEEGLRLLRELGDNTFIAQSLGSLAWVVELQGEYERAGEMYVELLRLSRELGIKFIIADALVGLAVVARVQQEHERATQLLGAADAVWKSFGGSPESGTRKRMEETSREARTGLGATAYESAWNEGRAMTVEQAIGYALVESGHVYGD